MKLVSWTLDGLQGRADAVLAWVEALEPEVVCLRETRTPDGAFPLVALWELGYYTKLHGAAGGLAILSVEPPRAVTRAPDGACMSGRVAGVRILNAAPSASSEAVRTHVECSVAPHEQLLVVGPPAADDLERLGDGVFANVRLAPKCAALEPRETPCGSPALVLTFEGLPPPRIPDLDITR